MTLRELKSCRVGLVREAPVGSYFDSTHVSLQQSVESMNQAALVFAQSKAFMQRSVTEALVRASANLRTPG